MEFFSQKVWWKEKNSVLLHPHSEKRNAASVAQLVRAPDC